MSVRSILFACGVLGGLALFPHEAFAQCSSGRQGGAMIRSGSMPVQSNTLRQAQLNQLVLQQRQLQLQLLVQQQLQTQLQAQQLAGGARQPQDLQTLQTRAARLSDAALQRSLRSSNQLVRQVATAELNRRRQEQANQQ